MALAIMGMLVLLILVAGVVLYSANRPMIAVSANDSLSIATAEGNAKQVAVLLKQGINPNTRALDGKTPLIIATMCENAAIVRLLLSQGADTTLKGDNGLTALDWARRSKNHEIKDLLEGVGRGQ
jgi:ankyrin repeat protein